MANVFAACSLILFSFLVRTMPTENNRDAGDEGDVENPSTEGHYVQVQVAANSQSCNFRLPPMKFQRHSIRFFFSDSSSLMPVQLNCT